MRELFNFKDTKFSFSRPIGSYSKVCFLWSAIIRNRRIQLARMNLRGRRYLNIGCGPNIKPGFVNIDYAWQPGIDLCWDITNGIPFPDGSMQGIFTEHCLEHIAFDKCRDVLRECRRVLKKGGLLRVVVPDAQLYVDLYARFGAGGITKFPYAHLNSHETPMMAVNRVFNGYGHAFGYDEETLRNILCDAGFVDIRREHFMCGRDKTMLIDNEWRARESLYMEGSY